MLKITPQKVSKGGEINLLADLIQVARGLKPAELVFKKAQIVNVFTETLIEADLAIWQGQIAGLGEYQGEQEIDCRGKFLAPGLIEGHLHLESSHLAPQPFAHLALQHGTTAIIADPHEILNVCGLDGLEFMLQEAEYLPLDLFLLLSSCVPANSFEENGANLTAEALAPYWSHSRILGLAEMMDFPGLLHLEPEILAKIQAAHCQGQLIDGHAPLLSGKDLNAYVAAGIYSEHECTNYAEALEKLELGQWIMIRDGSASRDLAELLPLWKAPYYQRCCLVSDDLGAELLMEEGHLDRIIRQAIRLGADPIRTIKMASYNPALYFKLPQRGALGPGYRADLVLLDDLSSFKINSVYKNGRPIPEQLEIKANPWLEKVQNTVHLSPLSPEQMNFGQQPIIGFTPGQLLTQDGGLASGVDLERDLIKLALWERHRQTGHGSGAYLQGYGLQQGAIAQSISHDSHNLIGVGVNDQDLALAFNRLAEIQGGVVLVLAGQVIAEVALPLAGLMAESREIIKAWGDLKALAHSWGVKPEIEPFMALSFLALPVIPELKLTTKGVVRI